MLTDKLVIPENTKFEENTIFVEGDVIVCPNSTVGYGIYAKKIVLGEKVKVLGDVVGEEVRIDSWCDIKGNVVSKGDAYISDFTTIEGRLTVFGDLDVGRNVKIKNGFEARGLISIQDPLPIVIFIFFYLLELLRLGKLEEAEKLLEELEDEEIVNPMIIPENTVLNLDSIKTNAEITITNSRVLGNIRSKKAEISGSEVFGSVRCENEVIVSKSKIHGMIEGSIVIVLRGSIILGDINAVRVYIEEDCIIEGTVTGETGVFVKQKIDVNKILLNKEVEEESTKEKEEKIENVEENRVLRKDPFKFERPDKIPSAKEVKKEVKEAKEIKEIEKSVKLLKELESKKSKER